MESKTFNEVKSRVRGKIKPIVLSSFSHHLIPGHIKNHKIPENPEEFDFKFSSEKFKEYPYGCDFPKPLLPPSKLRRDFFEKIDPTMQIVRTKAKIEDDINRYVEICKKNVSSLDKLTPKDIKWKEENNKGQAIQLPRYVAETAAILQCDPDPFFSGTYNWYYTGGTLTNLFYNEKNILIFPYSQELIALPVHLKEDYLYKPDFRSAGKISFEGTVHEILHSVQNASGIILLRQKYNCILYKIFNLDKNKLELLKISRVSSDVPYITADFDPVNKNQYCTVNSKHMFSIYDINKAKALINENIARKKYLDDCWGNIKYDKYRSDILLFIDRNWLYQFDTRIPLYAPALSVCIKNDLENCEFLSSFSQSCSSEFYSYICSNHSLCLHDIRMNNSGIVKKWTNQFKSPPLFLNTYEKDNIEFVIMSSQLVGETSIVLNDWKSAEDELPISCCLPFSPPSIIESLTASQFQGNCLDPNLKTRLSCCSTGQCAIVDPASSEIFLYTQNSLNDIFYQGVGHQENLDIYSLENHKSLNKLKMWENQIIKNSHNDAICPLVMTDKSNAVDIFQNFTNRKIQAKMQNESKTEDYTPSWKRSITELRQFTDIFAPELLAQWEISEEAAELPTSAAPHQKVLSWLELNSHKSNLNNQYNNTSGNYSQNLPDQEDYIQKHNDQEVYICDTDPVEEIFLPKVKSQSQRSKEKKKHSTYVPGF